MRFTLRSFTSVVSAVVALTALPGVAHAHFIWATVENGQVRFALLENIAEPPNPKFESYVTSLAPTCGDKKVTLSTPKAGASYAKLPTGQSVMSAESTIGVKDRNGETYLLVYYARGAATLAAANTTTKVPAELSVRKDGESLVVTLSQDGWPVPQGEVYVQWPGAETPTTYPTDIKGEAKVPWPTVADRRAGFLGLRAVIKQKKTGTHDGKQYGIIHRWTTLTFPVDGTKVAPAQQISNQQPAAQPPAAGKPFTQILRESYGVNHDVVGNALFNQTLFAGKLTKEQIEIHLQQRALIHGEVNRILLHANPALKVPYGPDQKNVITFLFNDLTQMGSNWPTEAQARPLTAAFLQEIRESEKKGPYFALGIQHVYYGGITNGGRMIGQKIGENLGFEPTYYEKSDGYRPYLTEVDKITDPAARAEMIRGGKAAYQYIIASMNEDVFKTK